MRDRTKYGRLKMLTKYIRMIRYVYLAIYNNNNLTRRLAKNVTKSYIYTVSQ